MQETVTQLEAEITDRQGGGCRRPAWEDYIGY